MRTALHFGAGNIGRGFIGKLLADSGWQVIFADINTTIIDRLNQDCAYTVSVVSSSINRKERVENVCGILSNDADAVAAAVQKTDLITTAVGPTVLEVLAPSLAQALAARYRNGGRPLNIIACENMIRGTSFLKDKVLAAAGADAGIIETNTGFVDSAVDRIVPPVAGGDADPLAVTVEDFSEWIVDASQFKGDIPKINGMITTDNLMAYVERKLFTLNTGHAAAAYLGKLAGKATVKDAIDDPTIHASVKKLMRQSGAVLVKRYGFDADAHAVYIEKILKRFANPHLHDDVDRVGRQPLRKLAANDRLVKPLNGMLEYNLPHDAAITAIAAALKYQNADDPQAAELQSAIQTHGLIETLRKYTGISQPELLEAIEQAYQRY